MSHPIRFLWSVPRSVSTSFERMMVERGDHTVFDEPFSRAYYYGPDRRSDRYEGSPTDSSAQEILEEIEQAAEHRPVFVKDMAYQAVDLLGPDLFARFDNSFLVRHPAATLRSYARPWPDFTAEEAGWDHLDQAADIVEELGDPLVVIDAEVLCREPEAVVQEWCHQMDLPYVADAMTWEPGMLPQWELWEEFHHTSAKSSGFEPLDAPPPPPGPDEPHLHDIYQAALPVYERLSSLAIGTTAVEALQR